MSRVAHPAGPRHADVPPAGHPPAPPADLSALDPAVWPRGARRAGGVLTLAGLDVRDLAGEYGTPLYVLDEADFRGRCRDFRQAFGEDAAVFYAAAAFCCRGVLRWAAEEGLARAYFDGHEACPAVWPGMTAPGASPGGRAAAPTAAARLWLAAASRTALLTGLGLLGVSAPDRL